MRPNDSRHPLGCQCCLGRIILFGDLANGSGRVMHRHRLPTPVREDRLGLGQGLGVGSDPLDSLEGRPVQAQQGMADFNQMFGDDVDLSG